ncbi:MAG: diaminopimelate epimerase [Candidatus Aminicenantes bacterium]|nr:MAG: diaminopimelate epimerase [Candidatus Aminicenantes bacterium]
MKFTKLSATGNDFILFDNREKILTGKEQDFFRNICERKQAVGADGVILLENSQKVDFKYRHFNSDGSQAEMCGNGARAICYFATVNHIVPSHHNFEVYGVIHEAWVSGREVKLRIPPPAEINTQLNIISEKDLEEGGSILFGVPHLVIFAENIEAIDAFKIGKKYCYHPYFENRTNVNFVQILDSRTIKVRTFERGVDDETLSCGTGSTASAIASHLIKGLKPPIEVQTSGGSLKVDWNDLHDSVSLTGEVQIIYEAKLRAFI